MKTLIFSLILCALAMVYMPAHAAQLESKPLEAFRGRPSPDLKMQNAKGEAVALTAFKGKVVVLNLWATWCPPCVRELPFLQQLQQQYAEKGLVVVALSLDRDGVGAVTPFFEKQNITLPIYVDTKNDFYKALQVRGLPTTFLMNRKGEFVARIEGDTDWMSDENRRYIESLLNMP